MRAATSATTETGARSTRTRTIGIRTAAVAMRFSKRSKFRSEKARLQLLVVRRMLWIRMRFPVIQPAIAPLPLLVFGDTFKQMHSPKIWPQCRRHVNLGICQLPQQEVAKPHLAAGAHHKIRIRQRTRIEMACDRIFVDFEMINATIAGGVLNNRAKCVHQFAASAVI